jgi:hypothetical protein
MKHKSRITRGLRSSPWLSWAVVALLALPPNLGAQQTPAPQQTKPMAPLPTVQNLKVVPLAGNREMNDLERKIMAPLVVEVLDQEDRPVEGAEVVFRFPLTGPGAVFTGQKNSQTVRTNGQGEAAATGWMTNNEVGTFQVHVTAVYGNQMGETTISMTNVTRIVNEGNTRRKHRRWYSSRWSKIGMIAGGAALVTGIVLATRGGGSTTKTISISPGSPTVGGPQ